MTAASADHADGNPDDIYVPHVSVVAFCETPALAEAVARAAADRRMRRASVRIEMGGVPAAIAFFEKAPTPNLILIESQAAPPALIPMIDRLASVSDPASKAIVVGHSNDIGLYRDLLARGVSEYVVMPAGELSIISAISRMYQDRKGKRLGRSFAFVGAKGGVGSSTVAHNVAWTIARSFAAEVVVADLDLPFGTASLDYNVDVAHGVCEAVESGQRLDELLLDRLVTKCGERLGSLVAPGALDRPYDFAESAFDRLIEVAQMAVPILVLDVPHAWNAWTRRVLVSADEVIVTMAPDLAQLRNAKGLVDHLRELRPNDGLPRLVLNQVGVPKRPEIRISDITAALDLEPVARIPFDPWSFGTAANKGKMIADIGGASAVVAAFAEIANTLCGRAGRRQKRGFDLGSLRQKLSLRRGGPESSRAA